MSYQRQSSNSGSCLLSLVIAGLTGLIVIAGISLVAFHYIPSYQITVGQGDLSQILKMGGGGLLISVLGFFLINGGFKAIFTRHVIVTDDDGRRREKSGCSAVFQGLMQLFFGIVCLGGGFGLMTLVFYQEIMPWLGF